MRAAATVVLRAGSAVVTVLLVALAAFAALTAAPGDALTAFEGEPARAADPVRESALRRELGLDRPAPERFVRWCGAAVTGDLGRSLRTGRPVTVEIGDRLAATLELNAAALVLVMGVGLPLGWWLARRRGRIAARLPAAVLLALYAAPAFWLALLLQDLFAVHWQLLPLYGRTPAAGDATPLERLRHLVLPATCLALHGLAFYARLAAETATAGWHSRHALAARALGLAERALFARHGVRPSLVPLAALSGLLVPALAAGSVLIETVFAWPGIGVLFVGAVQARDVPVVLALSVIAGALTVGGSLLADVLLALADPRIRRAPGPA